MQIRNETEWTIGMGPNHHILGINWNVTESHSSINGFEWTFLLFYVELLNKVELN
jgi:hypothetical protein